MEILETIKKSIDLSIIDRKMGLVILFVLVAIDVATGFINAFLNKNLDSTKMKKGLVGKLYEFIIVAVSSILDYICGTKSIMIGTVIFYIMQEQLSIIENTATYISYPKIIKEALKTLKEHCIEKEGEK